MYEEEKYPHSLPAPSSRCIFWLVQQSVKTRLLLDAIYTFDRPMAARYLSNQVKIQLGLGTFTNFSAIH